MQDKIQEIRAKVDEVVALAEKTYNFKMPAINVRFDLTGKAAGMAGCRNSIFSGPTNLTLRFNRTHIALGGKTYDHMLNDVVAHEVAHLVCYVKPALGKNHNPGWKRVCVALGGNGLRCYDGADAPEADAKQNPYIYVTDKGNEVRVNARTHAKIQRGSSFRWRHGIGSVTSKCEFRYAPGETLAPAKPEVKKATPKAAPKAKVVAGPGVSKADLIRTQIKCGKSFEECVAYGVNVLGMKPALARTYVKNNWAACQ